MGFNSVDSIFERIESGEVGRRPEGHAATKEGEARYALRPAPWARWTRQVNEFLQGKLRSGDILEAGYVPNVLRALGARGTTTILRQQELGKLLHGKHGPAVDPEVIKRLPEPAL